MKLRTALLTVTCTMLVCLLLVPAGSAQCAKIKDGTILASTGGALSLGYDRYGYNYQAHLFNGFLENYSRPDTPVTESDTNLVMKWSDDWLSNQDCWNDATHTQVPDTRLDRGGDGSGTSKGWCTNHFEGDYLGDDGEMHHWTEFVKIVWVGPPPEGSDPWAGKRIWGQYAIIEDVINDNYGGFHGVDKSTLVNPAGLGYWTN